MEIREATALVTGANRGLGREFVRQLLAGGAAKVYATARNPETIDVSDPRVRPLQLDITDHDGVAATAATADDVDLLINNAGVLTLQNLVTGDLDAIRLEMDTHFWGTLAMTRAFAPILGRNGGGAIVNVMSVLSFRTYPGNGAYAAAKAAEWQLTNSTRLELGAQGTAVLGLHLSATDTDMMAGWDLPKNEPTAVVRAALEGVRTGVDEVLADAETREVKSRLGDTPEVLYAPMRELMR
jgi:NAD(P)-dependent dehydrogenase (short-subunit alcohol dehydrogenase family)